MTDFYKLCTVFANSLKALGYNIYGDNILDYISPDYDKGRDFLTGYIQSVHTTIVDINHAEWPEFMEEIYIYIVYFES